MTKLKSFMLRPFTEEPKSLYTIEVPVNSKFIDCIAIPEGIIALYEVPSYEIEVKTEEFVTPSIDEDLPENGKCVAIIQGMTENKDKELITIIIPVYKLN